MYMLLIQVHAEAIFLLLFLFSCDSIVYAMPFKHDWILMNGLFTLNARWLCKLLWKHIHFLIDEIHTNKLTRTQRHEHALTQIHFDAFAIHTILHFPLCLIYATQFGFFYRGKKTSTFNVYAIDIFYVLIFSYCEWVRKKKIKFNFLTFKEKKNVIIFYSCDKH